MDIRDLKRKIEDNKKKIKLIDSKKCPTCGSSLDTDEFHKEREKLVSENEYCESCIESYFPAGLLIGTVESATLDEVGTTYTVRVRLAADLSGMNNLVVIENLDYQEIHELRQSEVIKYLETN